MANGVPEGAGEDPHLEAPPPNHTPETGEEARARQRGYLLPTISDFTAQTEESLYFKKRILTQAGFGSNEFMGRMQENLVKPS